MKLLRHVKEIKDDVQKQETLKEKLDVTLDELPRRGVARLTNFGVTYGTVPVLDDYIFEDYNGLELHLNYTKVGEPAIKVGIVLNGSARKMLEVPDSYITLTADENYGEVDHNEIKRVKEQFFFNYSQNVGAGRPLEWAFLPNRLEGRIYDGKKVVEFGNRVLEFQRGSSQLSLPQKFEYVQKFLSIAFGKKHSSEKENVTWCIDEQMDELLESCYALFDECYQITRKVLETNPAGLMSQEIGFLENYLPEFNNIARFADAQFRNTRYNPSEINFRKCLKSAEALAQYVQEGSQAPQEIIPYTLGIHRFAQKRERPEQIYLRLGRIARTIEERMSLNGPTAYSEEFGTMAHRYETIADKIMDK